MQKVSTVKITRLYDYQTWQTHLSRNSRGAQRFVGFISWLCFSGSDWLDRQTPSTESQDKISGVKIPPSPFFRSNVLILGSSLKTVMLISWPFWIISISFSRPVTTSVLKTLLPSSQESKIHVWSGTSREFLNCQPWDTGWKRIQINMRLTSFTPISMGTLGCFFRYDVISSKINFIPSEFV